MVYEAGDVLTCGSGGGFQPSYMWSGSSGNPSGPVYETVNTYEVPEGPFDVTCTVTATGPDQMPCTDSATASATAYSKYRNQCHTLVLLNKH